MADKSQETVTVRVSKRQYKEMQKIRRDNGPSIQWQVMYAVDLYLQDTAVAAAARQQRKES